MQVGEWLCKCKTLNAADEFICIDCGRRRGSWFRSTWMRGLLIAIFIVSLVLAFQYWADHYLGESF